MKDKLNIGDRVEFENLAGKKQFGTIVKIIRNNYIVEYDDNCNYVVLLENDIRRVNNER